MAKFVIPPKGIDIPGPVDWDNASHGLRYDNRKRTVETWCTSDPERKFRLRTRVRPMVGSEIIHSKLRGHTRTEVLKAYGVTEVWPPVKPPAPKIAWWKQIIRDFRLRRLKKRLFKMTRNELHNLQFRVSKLKGSSLEVNQIVAEHLGWRNVHLDPFSNVNRGLDPKTGDRSVVPDFTGSLDAAVSTVPEGWRESYARQHAGRYVAWCHEEGDKVIGERGGFGVTGPCAMLVASLNVRMACLDAAQ